MPPYDIFFPITNIHMSWHRVINPYAIQVINGTLHRILILCFDISNTESLRTTIQEIEIFPYRCVLISSKG